MIRADFYYCGLMAHLLGKLKAAPVELLIIANGDATYAATRKIQYRCLFRWRWLERMITRFNLSRADGVAVGSANNINFALSNGARTEAIKQCGNVLMIHPAHFERPEAR